MKLKNKFYVLMLIELLLMILVGKWVGALPVLIFTAITFLLGLSLIRGRNLAMIRQMQNSFYEQKPFEFNFIESTIISFGGILLIIPGFLTDFVGLILLLPFLHSGMLKMFSRTKFAKQQQSTFKTPSTFEGEFWHDEEKPNKDDDANKLQ